MFWVSLIGAIFVVLFAGAMSGLTLGLLGLDKLSLKIMTLSGPPIRRMYATKVLGLVKVLQRDETILLFVSTIIFCL